MIQTSWACTLNLLSITFFFEALSKVPKVSVYSPVSTYVLPFCFGLGNIPFRVQQKEQVFWFLFQICKKVTFLVHPFLESCTTPGQTEEARMLFFVPSSSSYSYGYISTFRAKGRKIVKTSCFTLLKKVPLSCKNLGYLSLWHSSKRCLLLHSPPQSSHKTARSKWSSSSFGVGSSAIV